VKGYRDTLILHAFKTTMEATEKIGILGIVVDAKDKKAASFYEGF
jgi:50S ribosomal subunit-associated GTPase HflX